MQLNFLNRQQFFASQSLSYFVISWNFFCKKEEFSIIKRLQEISMQIFANGAIFILLIDMMFVVVCVQVRWNCWCIQFRCSPSERCYRVVISPYIVRALKLTTLHVSWQFEISGVLKVVSFNVKKSYQNVSLKSFA